ncbi:MAG: glycosyltransferase [Methanobrevibacter sp.]|nr:glycosyltransferase [Methanobrevibacter sp.]
MSNTKISVIIPIYNSEKYLKDCLDSVTKQSLKDIQIICINDGSTDRSLEILREYASNDSRFVIINQENKGAGVARNIGLDNATGEYISFIDSDDWIKKELYKKTYSLAKSKNLDMIMFKMINYEEKTKKLYETAYYNLNSLHDYFDGTIFSTSNTKDKIFQMSVSPGNKLYKRELIEELGLRFPEGIIFEDSPFFMELYLNSKKNLVIDEYLYYRRRSEGSVTTLFDEHYQDIIPMTNILIDIFKKYNKFEKYKKGLINFKVAFTRKKYLDVHKNRKKIFKIIKEDFLKMKENCLADEDIERFFYNDNLSFFLNITQSSDFEKFELLNKISVLEIENKNLKKAVEKWEKFKSKQPIKLLLKIKHKIKF